MLTSAEMIRFGISKRNSLPVKCLRCQWVRLCNGECPKHRFSVTEDGQEGLNALSAAMKCSTATPLPI